MLWGCWVHKASAHGLILVDLAGVELDLPARNVDASAIVLPGASYGRKETSQGGWGGLVVHIVRATYVLRAHTPNTK